MLGGRQSAVSRLQQFLALEAAGGIVLGAAAILALVWANSALGLFYTRLLDTPLAIQIGSLLIKKPLLLWVNDGLMAVFFMLVGLEVKREIAEGGLSSPAKAALPLIAAVGGMAGPALIYAALNWGDARALRGWAIRPRPISPLPSGCCRCWGRGCRRRCGSSCLRSRSSTISARS